MTKKIGKGVIFPAKFTNIIDDLYENEKISSVDGTKTLVNFAVVKLTTQQLGSLVYPSGLTPIGINLIYQVDTFDSEKNLQGGSQLFLVSFVQKGDGFIYAYYFRILNQHRFEIKQLQSSDQPLQLSTLEFTPLNYLEVYTDIRGLTITLGIEISSNTRASLQYAKDKNFFRGDLNLSGLLDTSIPETELTGLSDSLKKLKLPKNRQKFPL